MSLILEFNPAYSINLGLILSLNMVLKKEVLKNLKYYTYVNALIHKCLSLSSLKEVSFYLQKTKTIHHEMDL